MSEERRRRTIVIGHKNPDTDSICSAICYAALKSKITGKEYVPPVFPNMSKGVMSIFGRSTSLETAP